MDNIINSDIQSTSIIASSSKNENGDEKVSTLSQNTYSNSNIDSPPTIIENDIQYFNEKINDDGKDYDLEMEDILLGIKDREGNFLRNDDEYDLTEEEENFLLYNDCSEDYVRNIGMRDLIKFHNIDHDGNNLTVNTTPLKVNQYDQPFTSSDTNSSSNNYHSNANEDGNIDTSNVEMSDSITLSIVPTVHIEFKGLHSNSEIKLNDEMKVQENVDSAGDENVLDSNDAEVSNNDENNGDISEKFQNKYYREPADVNYTQNTHLSPKKMPMDLSMPNDDENYSNHESLTEERISPEISNGKFNLSKIMKSETSRRCYLSLLKERTQSLLISYNKYKNAHLLQYSSKYINELNPTKAEKSTSSDLFQQSKKNEIELLEDNKVISFLDVQPLNGFFVRASDETTAQSFITQQSQDQIRNERLFKIYPKANNKKVKNTASKTLVEEEIARHRVGLVYKKARKDANENFHTFPRIKYTEILNKFPLQNIDLEATNHYSNTVSSSGCENIACDTEENDVPLSKEKFHQKRTQGRILKLKTNFSTQTLHNLFSLNNKIAIDIMSVLENKQFKKGASLLDVMKHFRQEIKTKLRQDISNFLKAAVDVGIIQMKHKRYVIPKRKAKSNRIQAVENC